LFLDLRREAGLELAKAVTEGSGNPWRRMVPMVGKMEAGFSNVWKHFFQGLKKNNKLG
jgi:hypothetical protein